MSDDYDVVLDVLQKHHDILWKMTERNMQSEFLGMNIMDDIRLEQMDQLKLAMNLWKNRNILAGESHHTDKGYQESTHERQAEFAKKRNYTYDKPDDTIL